jgi:hypothetical protein
VNGRAVTFLQEYTLKGHSGRSRLTIQSVSSLGLGLILLFIPSHPSLSQEEFSHPELKWTTIETEHFYVHYHEGEERTAQVVAKIAEEIYDPITSLYHHKPDQKVSFVIRDVDDISNGAAYFFDNKIELYAPSMDFEFRGTHNWLRNVVTHEFTHIIQIQTSMKFGRRMPALYLQWLGYESERRQDVLYGFPNVIVSYPISGFVVPAWFAEGVAQFNRPELRYDFWDTHRDMILRSYALDGNMLTWDEMGVFGKTSLGNESSYNAGFAFVSYIAKTYGEQKLEEISRNLATLTEVSIDGAMERALGKSGRDVYNEWVAMTRKDYEDRTAGIRSDLHQGHMLQIDSSVGVVNPGERQKIESMIMGGEHPPLIGRNLGAFSGSDDGMGFANLYPVYSPDGSKIAYVSTKGGDYFSLSSLYVYDITAKTESLIRPGVRTAPAWSPDGTKLYYGKLSRDHPHWSLQYDLYEYSLATKSEKRITQGRRALTPTVSPDGESVAFVVDADGTSNLAVARVDGSDFRTVTTYSHGEQVYNPKWSPAGDRILFEYSIKDGRDIADIRPDGSGLRFLVQGSDDSRDGSYSPDGKEIIFASDRTGIFNLYRYDLLSGAVSRLTNVLGGAFCPSMNAAGDIAYSGYTSAGYKVFLLPHVVPAEIPPEHDYVLRPGGSRGAAGQQIASADGMEKEFDWNALRNYDDTQIPSLQSKPYKSIFTSLTFVPLIRVDNYNTHNKAIDDIKPGLYIFSNDMLEKLGFFAGAALNRQLERDLFLQFTYSSKIPLLYELGLEPTASVELYNVSRKTDSRISLPREDIPVSVTYDLLEFDFALSQPLISQFSTFEFRYAHSRYTSIIDNFINPETQSVATGSSELYLIANTLFLTVKLDAVAPSRTVDINPVGRRVMLRIGRELNKIVSFDSAGNAEYEESPTGPHPKYARVNFTRLELSWKEYLPFFFRDQTISIAFHGSTIPEHTVDDFFDSYAGGLIGMRGYPFYALAGNEMATVGLTYRFPISNNLDIRFLQLYFDKLYASVFADVGNAWSSTAGRWKRDAGAELRLESFSYYAYPTRIFFGAAYGFDRFNRYVPSRSQTVTYGKEWRFYFGVLFGFDFD